MSFHLHDLLSETVSGDSSRQMTVPALLQLTRAQLNARAIVDFGCGAITGERELLAVFPEAMYVGVDVPQSPEVSGRQQPLPSRFVVYDGSRLPFRSDSVQLVFSRQVLEHVPQPELAMAEINRVLEPGGLFVGSTSHLEAFHSFSYWNFTPYGMVQLARRFGLQATLVAPGIDAAALLWRRFRASGRNWMASESPGNRLISGLARWKRWDARFTNCVKLQFCGHFFFMFRKT
jgi:SAM-dependent methyltransferase